MYLIRYASVSGRLSAVVGSKAVENGCADVEENTHSMARGRSWKQIRCSGGTGSCKASSKRSGWPLYGSNRTEENRTGTETNMRSPSWTDENESDPGSTPLRSFFCGSLSISRIELCGESSAQGHTSEDFPAWWRVPWHESPLRSYWSATSKSRWGKVVSMSSCCRRLNSPTMLRSRDGSSMKQWQAMKDRSL